MQTQKEKILEYLRDGNVLTGIYATNTMHIMDYRKRISELRQDGWVIDSEMHYEYYKSGKMKGRIRTKYNRYWLAKKRRKIA